MIISLTSYHTKQKILINTSKIDICYFNNIYTVIEITNRSTAINVCESIDEIYKMVNRLSNLKEIETEENEAKEAKEAL